MPLTSADRDLLRRVRRYSSITDDQRKEIDTCLRSWLPRQKKIGPKEEQHIADVFRAPLQTVGRTMVSSVVEVGIVLRRLQEQVAPGTWLRLFRDAQGGAKALLRPIPLSIKQAQAYMRIARHPILSNADVFDALPPHWRTLDELTRVPDAVLNTAITRGAIHPEMERADVAAMRQLERLPGMPKLGPVETWPTPDDITETDAGITEDDVDAALDRVLGLAVQAGLSAPAMARKLRARAATLDEVSTEVSTDLTGEVSTEVNTDIADEEG